MTDSFNARKTLSVGDRSYDYYDLKALEEKYKVSRLPYSLKILLENLLRTEDGVNVTRDDIEALANWDAKAEPSKEIAFAPASTLSQYALPRPYLGQEGIQLAGLQEVRAR